MMHRIELRHNFETAHRLLHEDAPTKCRSIHGHSWWATVTLEGETLDEMGMLVEFGAFKKAWRAFLDDNVDHHLCVQTGDPLVAAIRSVMPDARILEVPFDPTTELMARWLYDHASRVLMAMDIGTDVFVAGVHVQETSVNAASYFPRG